MKQASNHFLNILPADLFNFITIQLLDKQQ